jgi:hypothetical protein
MEITNTKGNGVMSIEKEPQGDPTMTWVYGKVEPGWYIAREIWTEEYARHLKALGYDVERSVGKPKRKPVNRVARNSHIDTDLSLKTDEEMQAV